MAVNLIVLILFNLFDVVLREQIALLVQLNLLIFFLKFDVLGQLYLFTSFQLL
jgi:hypothetical protein